MAVSLHTPRLLLRQWREDDLVPYTALNLDPDVMRYFPALQTPEDSRVQVERFKKFIEETDLDSLH
jgi:RimJ/RimL family protein N-acetyltransferase